MRLALFREQLEVTTSLALNVHECQAHRLFMVVYNQLDAVGHHFPRHQDPSYPSHDPKRSPRYQDVIGEFHRRLDEAVGRILCLANREALILVVSDHGMGPRATKFFNVNYWLHTLGLLRPRSRRPPMFRWGSRFLNLISENLPIRQELRRFLPPRLKAPITSLMFNAGGVLWAETKAYRIRMLAPIEGIHLNVRGRQPSGIVEPTMEYEELRDVILTRLREVRDPDTQEPIVVQAWRREELYAGPHVERAPDIVFQLKPDYEAGASAGPPVIAPLPRSFLKMRSGSHTMEGIFIAKGPGVRSGCRLDSITLQDVAPTVLYYVGLPVPSNMDGRVVQEAFLPEFLAANPVCQGPPLSSSQSSSSGLTVEEAAAMREQLRGLGYL
jgi:predicted AlkP superfamily phosphohydrolase/phosphomutase